jgi:protein SCO1/2
MRSLIIPIIIIFLACSSGLEKGEQLPDFPLKDQNGKEFTFSQLRGKVIVLSYIYTHCPDICHIITKRMTVLRDKLKKNNIDDERVYFVSITIDPERDTPETLKKHVKMMNLDLTNWVFVTGDEDSINSTIKVSGMEAIKETDVNSKNDDVSYFITHRDRISLVDDKGTIRKHYKGTNFDFDALMEDIDKVL